MSSLANGFTAVSIKLKMKLSLARYNINLTDEDRLQSQALELIALKSTVKPPPQRVFVGTPGPDKQKAPSKARSRALEK